MQHLFAMLGIWLAAPKGVVLAQALPPASEICNPLIYGCGGAAANVLSANAPEFLLWMLHIAAAICLAVIVWSGFGMFLSLGDEGHISKNRMNVLWALIGLVLVLSAQVIVGAVGTTNFGQTTGEPLLLLAGVFRVFIASIRMILNITFVIVAVIAGIRMVYAQGKQDEFTKGKTMLIGAISGALIVNLATALIRAVLVIFA